MTKKFLLPLDQYNRIHQVAHGVLEQVATVERACVFFACFGSYLLNKHYRIPATAVAGAFALCVNDRQQGVFFGKDKNGAFNSSDDGFHMWIQTKTHIIDFMAPIFPECFAPVDPTIAVPRRMLQRPIGTEAASTANLKRPGDFVTFPNPELSEALTDNFLGRAANTDLLMVGEAWFGSPRARQQPSFAMVNDEGQVHRLSLPGTRATGAW